LYFIFYNNLFISYFFVSRIGPGKVWREANPELISGENSAESLLERIRAEKKKNSPQRLKGRKGKTNK